MKLFVSAAGVLAVFRMKRKLPAWVVVIRFQVPATWPSVVGPYLAKLTFEKQDVRFRNLRKLLIGAVKSLSKNATYAN